MSSIPITLVGKTTVDLAGNTVFVGQAFSPSFGGGGPPGYPTHPWLPPYGPAHPIAPGGPPPGVWGPIGPYPDAGFPGPQPGGPIGIWGPIIHPDQGLPWPQPPFPLPPGGAGAGQWRWVYSLRYGWVLDPGEGGKPQPPGGAGSEPGEPPHPEHLPA